MATNDGTQSIPTIPTNLSDTIGLLVRATGKQSIPTIPTNLSDSLGLLVRVTGTQSIPSGGSTTTYFYRLGGPPYTRGNTTTQGGWPVGSVIEYILVS